MTDRAGARKEGMMAGTTDVLLEALAGPPATRQAALDVIARVLHAQADNMVNVRVGLHAVPRADYDAAPGRDEAHELQRLEGDTADGPIRFWAKEAVNHGSALSGLVALRLYTDEPPHGWQPPTNEDEQDQGGEAA